MWLEDFTWTVEHALELSKRKDGELFKLRVGLRKGCFLLFMDIVVISAGKMQTYICMWVIEGLALLFADDTKLLADWKEKPCDLVSEFGRVFWGKDSGLILLKLMWSKWVKSLKKKIIWVGKHKRDGVNGLGVLRNKRRY